MAQSRHVLIKLISGGFMLATIFVYNPHSAIFIYIRYDSPCAVEDDLLIYFYIVHALL